MPPPRVLLCTGTRPDIIKMAPVYHALLHTGLEPVVLHTGQHQEMAWPLYDFFGFQPDHCLPLRRERASLGHLSALLIDGIDTFMARRPADAVLVHGDTSSAMAAALVAFYHQRPVGHVEAGLRSYDAFDPFPEEKNREMIARLATWHFAPTPRAVRNLLDEGHAADRIHCVGNTVVDAARWGLDHLIGYFTTLPASEARQLRLLTGHVPPERLLLVTAHRREHWNGDVAEIARAVRALVERHERLRAVWPVHPNPVVRSAVEAVMADLPPSVAGRIHLTGALNYPQMLWLLRHAWLVLTDSGGLQEEAAALQVPVLVLRNTTERPELIDAGGGALVGTDPAVIRARVEHLLYDDAAYEAMRGVDNPYGDGRAGDHIAALLARALAAPATRPMTYAA